VTVSVVVVAYRSGPSLLRCLESLAPEHQGELDVVVVDNGGGGPEIEAADRLPYVTVLSPRANLGYAGGSNLGAEAASGDVLVFLNPDTVATPAAVQRLAELLADRAIGLAMARLLLLDRPELLNSSGNILHLSALAWMGDYGKPASGLTEVRDIPYPCGAAFGIRSQLFRELGGFTETLFLYHEDVELAWRARLRGLRIVVDPHADVYHDYDFSRNARKNYFMERNRLVFVLSAYSGRLMLVLAPVLVSAELAILLLATKEGWLRDKLAGWAWLARNGRWLARHRRETQRLRRLPDREVAGALTPVIDPGAIDVPLVARVANPLVSAYWALARRAL